MDCSLPGSSIHGIFQARVLEWVAISFSRESSQPMSPALQADILLSEPPGKPTDDKTSRLMVKRFPTVRDTLIGSQSYMEKRRGRRETEVTRRKRETVKRGETNLASNQFPKCSPQPGTPREIHKVK